MYVTRIVKMVWMLHDNIFRIKLIQKVFLGTVELLCFYNYACNFRAVQPIKKPFNSDQLQHVSFQIKPMRCKSVELSLRNRRLIERCQNHSFKYNFWTAYLIFMQPSDESLAFLRAFIWYPVCWNRCRTFWENRVTRFSLFCS